MFTATAPVSIVATRRVFWRRTSLAEDEPTPSVTPLVFTVVEACWALRVSRWTLYQLIRSGRLRTITIGRRRFVPREAIDELVERLSSEGLANG